MRKCIHCGKQEQDVDGEGFIFLNSPSNEDEVIHLRCVDWWIVQKLQEVDS